MKKTILVLLSILLIFSFTSCINGNDIEDPAKLADEFLSQFNDCYYTRYNIWDKEGGQVGNDLTPDQLDYSSIEDALQKLYDDDTIEIESSGKLTSASGAISYSATNNTKNWDFDKIKVGYLYTSNTVKTETAGELSFNGEYTIETNGSTITKTYKDVTINNKTYNISFTYDDSTKIISAATCNGKDVDVTILNESTKIQFD